MTTSHRGWRPDRRRRSVSSAQPSTPEGADELEGNRVLARRRQGGRLRRLRSPPSDHAPTPPHLLTRKARRQSWWPEARTEACCACRRRRHQRASASAPSPWSHVETGSARRRGSSPRPQGREPARGGSSWRECGLHACSACTGGAPFAGRGVGREGRGAEAMPRTRFRKIAGPVPGKEFAQSDWMCL